MPNPKNPSFAINGNCTTTVRGRATRYGIVLSRIDRGGRKGLQYSLMLKTGVKFRVPVRSLLLLGSLILLPAWARADDFSWQGDSSCSDPIVSNDAFVLPQTNATGGLCRAFGNHTGGNITSVKFTTPYQSTNPDFFCSAAPYFLGCDFNVDGTIYHTGDTPPTGGSMVTVEFFGTNSDHLGIPVDTTTGCTDSSTNPACYNFFINLNSYIGPNGGPCNPFTTGGCTQPTGTGGNGNWGAGSTVDAFANGAVPEPGSGALLVAAFGTLLARIRIARRRP